MSLRRLSQRKSLWRQRISRYPTAPRHVRSHQFQRRQQYPSSPCRRQDRASIAQGWNHPSISRQRLRLPAPQQPRLPAPQQPRLPAPQQPRLPAPQQPRSPHRAPAPTQSIWRSSQRPALGWSTKPSLSWDALARPTPKPAIVPQSTIGTIYTVTSRNGMSELAQGFDWSRPSILDPEEYTRVMQPAPTSNCRHFLATFGLPFSLIKLRKPALLLAPPAGIEPATFGLGNRCSIP